MSRADSQRTATVDDTTSADDAREQLNGGSRGQKLRNNVRRLREDRLLSKADLARKAGLSTLTIDRVEAGMPCRMNTKRKIILALGMTVAEKNKVFAAAEEQGDDEAEASVE